MDYQDSKMVTDADLLKLQEKDPAKALKLQAERYESRRKARFTEEFKEVMPFVKQ